MTCFDILPPATFPFRNSSSISLNDKMPYCHALMILKVIAFEMLNRNMLLWKD